jgi:hypothetical protein
MYNHLSIFISPLSKCSPLPSTNIMHLCQSSFQLPEYPLQSNCRMARSFLSDFVLSYQSSGICILPLSILNPGNARKFAGARFGKQRTGQYWNFEEKIADEHGSVYRRCIAMVQYPWIVSLQIRLFLSNVAAQATSDSILYSIIHYNLDNLKEKSHLLF